MNPRTVRWQAAVNFALLLMLSLLVAPAAVLWLTCIGLLWALALNAGYAYSLGKRGRSKRRIHGDRWIPRYVGFGLLLPGVIALALLLIGYDENLRIWDFTVNEISALLISLAVLFLVIISSSLTDWYYIRPRIDGVVCAPPCRSSGSDTWKGPTRWWYLHRGLVTLAYFGFAFVVALVIMLMLVREHPAAAGVIGGVGGLASLMLIFAGSYRAQLPTVAQFVLSPAYCLGDDLTYEAHKWDGRGFVLHVAVPVAKLVPLDQAGKPTGAPFVERKNSDLNESDLTSRRITVCAAECIKLNPECVVGSPRDDRRRHYLIV
jgi:hypothetical protein